MIFNRLDNAEQLEKLHPGFAAAFAFLRRTDLAELPAGRHEIDGSRVYAVVFRRQGKGKAGTKLEIHRKYIDIQHTVTDTDLIGWMPTSDLKKPEQPFNEEKDVQLFLEHRGFLDRHSSRMLRNLFPRRRPCAPSHRRAHPQSRRQSGSRLGAMMA